MDIVSKWCSLNKMTIDIRQTHSMIVTPSNTEKTIATKLSIRDINLYQVHKYEYLGAHIDGKLTMGAQIDIMVCTNVQKKYGILRKICRYISLDTALLIYKVMI